MQNLVPIAPKGLAHSINGIEQDPVPKPLAHSWGLAGRLKSNFKTLKENAAAGRIESGFLPLQ